MRFFKKQFRPTKKELAELHFQNEWAKLFPHHKDSVHSYWQQNRFLQDILDTAKLNANSNILDVGCGISSVLHFLPGKKMGIDPLASHYQKIYNYPEEMNIRTGHAEQVPAGDGEFDLVICSNALDHMDQPQNAIAEILRVLKPTGLFLLTVELKSPEDECDEAHPHNLDIAAIHQLVDPHFNSIIEKQTPWIGLKRWCLGNRTYKNQELILLLRKTD